MTCMTSVSRATMPRHSRNGRTLMTRRPRRLYAALLIAALCAAGCSKGGASTASSGSSGNKGPVPVALIVDLSGPNAEHGKPLAAGIKSYFKKLNDSGGIKGAKVDLTTIDARTAPDGAQAAVQQVYAMNPK